MEDRENDDEDEGLLEVLEENGNFVNAVLRKWDAESFLKSSEMVYGRSVAFEPAAQDVFLQYSTDIDGCVVELNRLQGVKLSVRRLTIFNKNKLRGITSMLRKHVDLTKYDKNGLCNFKHSVGFQLFFEGGWEGWIGVIPKVCRIGHSLDSKGINDLCENFFIRVRHQFQDELLKSRSSIRNSLLKNDINDVGNLSVLPDDQETILQLLQNAVEQCFLDDHFTVIIFCFRFGEKSRLGINMMSFDWKEIARVTVHAAMDICSEDMDLMWSMSGLQDIVGERGVLCNALSFRDCGNYQSNIDGREMAISQELRSVCKRCGKLKFIQLYVDTPHRKPHTRVHPVSGSIAGGLVFAENTRLAFKRDAKTYISTLESNFLLMEKSSCRLEVVMEPCELKSIMLGTDFINVDNVFSLIERTPLLVPFPPETIKSVRSIGLWICNELKLLLDKLAGTGNIEGIWRAFQMELAAEKILWGTPLTYISDIYSVNLGPGKLTPSRSLTDQRGFLALEKWSASMGDENSIPPCRIWTTSEAMISKIERSVGFHDVLQSTSFVIGRRMLHTLLDDFFEAGKLFCRKEEFKRDLFSDNPSLLRVNGAVTIDQIVQLLARDIIVGRGMIFCFLVKLIRRTDNDITTVLREGFKECGFKHFPAFKSWDAHRNSCLTWNASLGLWKVLGADASNFEMRNCPEILTSLVVAELERKGLVHASKLKTAPLSFPWMATTVRKLGNNKLDQQQLICVLSFVSCIALMANGWYVEYSSLEQLLHDLPVDQYKLRDYEILSKLLMGNFNKFKLFRLHPSMPWKMTICSKESKTSKRDEKTVESAEQGPTDTFAEDLGENRIRLEVEIADRQIVSARNTTCMPVSNSKRSWSGLELEVLHSIAKKRKEDESDSHLFESFKTESLKAGIPFRTFGAFRKKLRRIADE